MSPEPDDTDYTRFGTLQVEEKDAKPRPDVADILVAGGGPAGGTAAIRAKELGLSCLVLDYDDILKRIRDYPKEKPIKPSYGGGDKLEFPAGGELLANFHFDEIDKDDLVSDWKKKYKELAIWARIGSEFTGLERDGDIWIVKTWNHRAGKEFVYRARNVLVAMGAGVPRRFDIPGNTDGIAFRLDDAKAYVGAPALVIGGGTSAAEAVIAISNAKADAEDETGIYWSYRGASMPKVSRALSEEFFNAYVGNGNVRYLSYSEPILVVTADDKEEYLSVRVDRKISPGRPSETVHVEFPKHQVIACIGEDLPIKFLRQLGVKIPLVNNRPLMLLNKDGETSLPGVFLAGDVRGPKFLRCTDFDDSSTYEQVSMKRNIKAAMTEAVEVVEVIAARSGQVVAKKSVAPAPPKKKPKEEPKAEPAVVPPTPTEPEAARAPATEVQLVTLHPDDTPEEQFPVTRDSVVIGRNAPDVACPDDVYMTEQHAVLTKRDDQYVLEDHSDGAGVWIRAKGKEGRPVGEGALVWVGAQLLMVRKADGGWSIDHHDQDGAYQASHSIGDKGLFVGRKADATLDPSDLSLSRRHAQFLVEGDGLKVYDLGSKNGTYVKIAKPFPLRNGDEFRIGSKRFRFEHFEAVSKLAESDVIVDAPPKPTPEREKPSTPDPGVKPEAKGAVPEGAFPVEIEHEEYPVTFGASPDEDLLHAYFENLKERFPACKVTKTGEPSEHMDEPLGWECKVGLCGLCAVEILEGAENFVPPDPGSPEMSTVESKAFLEPDPSKNRLACLAKVKGPVKITIPS